MAQRQNGGRKPYKIDWNEVDKCLESGCNGEMTAAYLGMHPETLYRRVKEEKEMLFSDYIALKKSRGNAKLFHKQQELAENGDRGMLIWLGKNRLGQRDDPQIVEKLKDELTRFNQAIMNAKEPKEATKVVEDIQTINKGCHNPSDGT